MNNFLYFNWIPKPHITFYVTWSKVTQNYVTPLLSRSNFPILKVSSKPPTRWSSWVFKSACYTTGRSLETLYSIWPAQNLNLRPSSPRTNALPLDQLKILCAYLFRPSWIFLGQANVWHHLPNVQVVEKVNFEPWSGTTDFFLWIRTWPGQCHNCWAISAFEIG